MSTIGAGSPDTSGSLVHSQSRQGTSAPSLAFPLWLAETAERNQHRLGGFVLVAGVALIVWGTIAMVLAAFIFVI